MKNGGDVLAPLRKAFQEGHLPNVNYLSFSHCSFNRELPPLRKAFQDGRLPNLNYLSFSHCSFSREGILCYLFGRWTPALEHLHLWGIKINKNDLQFISELRTLRVLYFSTQPCLQTETVQCLANVWATLSDLGVCDIDSEFLEAFVRVVNENKLPNLGELTLITIRGSDIYIDISHLQLQSEKLPSLKHLHLKKFTYTGEDVQDLAQRAVKWDLEKLSITHSKGISGHLSVLLRHCLPSLTYLVLTNCELNSDDMRCLTEAREQGRLPKLEYLSVFYNRIKDPEMWMKNEAWKNVEIAH